MNKLVAYEMEEVETIDLQSEETKERFQITNIDQLNWAFRKLAALQEEQKDVENLAEGEFERINAWKEKETEKINRTQDFFQTLISEFALKKRIEDPKFKKITTPYGKFTWKKQQPKWNYDDEKVVQHLEENGLEDFFRTKKEPIKTDIKKLFGVMDSGDVVDPNGMVVNGLKVIPQLDKLDIKVGE